VQFDTIIDADLASLQGKSRLAEKGYSDAILMAGRRGLTHDQALAHERCGEHYMRKRDTDEAMYQLGRALTLYEEWGAQGKVDYLNDKYRSILSPPSRILVKKSALACTSSLFSVE
jgi:hypothetical protein